jgi:pimeloyl-ACP methyl ester carboxylesterase
MRRTTRSTSRVENGKATGWLEGHRRSFGGRPIRVLTAENHYHDDAITPPAVHNEHFGIEHEGARRRLLSLSLNSKQIIVRDSGHYIQFDRPKVVIDAIVGELHEHYPGRNSGGRMRSLAKARRW